MKFYCSTCKTFIINDNVVEIPIKSKPNPEATNLGFYYEHRLVWKNGISTYYKYHRVVPVYGEK